MILIREMMRPGFFRRAFRSRAGWLPLSVLLAAFSSRGVDKWDVRLELAVRGDYEVRGGGPSLAGDFRYGARWKGTLEREGDDYLLVHFQTEVFDWAIDERVPPPGERGRPQGRAPSEGPRLRMNYFLREGKDIRIDFEVEPIKFHLPPPAAEFDIPMPVSRAGRETGPGPFYSDFVTDGTSRVALREADLEGPPMKRIFAWEWRRSWKAVRDGKSCLVASRHRAEVVVNIVPCGGPVRPSDGSGHRRGGAGPG